MAYPKTFAEFEKAVDERTKEFPMLVKGAVRDWAKKVGKEDRDKNGIPDALDWLAKIERGVKLFDALNKVVDFRKFTAWLSTQPFIKDQALALQILNKAADEIEQEQGK